MISTEDHLGRRNTDGNLEIVKKVSKNTLKVTHIGRAQRSLIGPINVSFLFPLFLRGKRLTLMEVIWPHQAIMGTGGSGPQG